MTTNNTNTISYDDDHLERLVRKLTYYGSSIEKMVTNAHTSSKIVVVKKKIEQLEQLLLDIPDCWNDLFDEWLERVVQLWNLYSAAASAVGHRSNHLGSSVAYPKPSSTTTTNSSSAAPLEQSSMTGTVDNNNGHQHRQSSPSSYDVTKNKHTSNNNIVSNISNLEKRSALHTRTVVYNQPRHSSNSYNNSNKNNNHIYNNNKTRQTKCSSTNSKKVRQHVTCLGGDHHYRNYNN